MTKWVYSFGAGHNEGRADMRNLLGGKGANLAEMASIGLPVPAGLHHHDRGLHLLLRPRQDLPDELRDQVGARSRASSRRSGNRFGDTHKPLLVSVRSGRPRLHAGHDGHGAEPRPERRDGRGPRLRSGDARFAWDSYRRFIQMFGSVVLGVDHHRFEEIIEHVKLDRGVNEDTDSSAQDWHRVVDGYKDMVAGGHRQALPAGPRRAALGRDRRASAPG
jgi:pyruvate,orthophosphate dikinase